MIQASDALVKYDYYSSINSFNEKNKKDKFMLSTSNDTRTSKIAPSSSTLYMQSLGAAHTAGSKWVR